MVSLPHKNILIVTHYYPPHHGGIERVAQNQAERLTASGHQVCVVSSRVTTDEKSGTFNGVRVVRVKAVNFLEKRGIPFPLFSPSLLGTLWREVGRADVVHIHDVFYLSSTAAAALAFVRRRPLVLTQHVDLVPHPNPVVNLIERAVYATTGRFAFRQARRIITVNARVETFVQAYGVAPNVCRFLPNGVDAELFRPASAAEKRAARQKFKLPLNRPLVLFVGRATPKKGFDKVLAAASKEYLLVFAGGKFTQADTPNAKFLGELPPKVLAELFRAADVYVLPSEGEGFPLTVQEALASGLPSVITDDPGYAPYHLAPDGIVLLKKTDPKAIQKALTSLVHDAPRWRTMAKWSRAYAQANFSWEHLTTDLDAIYEEAMRRWPAANSEQPEVIVTTSWDDGHQLDERLSRLLQKYQIKATFYVAPRDHEFKPKDRLTDIQVRALSKNFEIGAHTMTHPRLDKVSDDVAGQEISDSKRYLERITKRPVTTFCYPGGNFKPQHVAMVDKAGFAYARTVKRHAYSLKGPLLEARTTINAYNHYQDLWKIAKFAKFNPFQTRYYFHWENLAKAMFDKVAAEGGVYHLWGHSWEIDKHGDWERLEDVLRYISGRPGARYVTNGELPTLQPKKLLIAAPYFPPHLGGVEMYSYHIGQELQKRYGWQVCVATSGDKGWRFPSAQTYDGLKVYRLPYWLKLSNSPLNPLWPIWLRRIIREEDVYVVNVQAPVPGLSDMAAATTKRQKLPLVVSYHMAEMAKGDSKLDVILKLYESKFLPAMIGPASRLICSTDKVRAFLGQYRAKSVTITPGVDTDVFRPNGHSPDRPTVLYVGSINKSDTHKGVAHLIRAMQAVVEAIPDARLVLIGPGTGQAAFMALAAEYGIARHVSIPGGKYDAELQEIFRQSSVFVLPSSNESFGMVIIEAMSSGLSVISTPVGVIPDLVTDAQTGYLVPPGDSQALAAKLIYVLQHPDLARKFGLRGRQRVLQNFDWAAKAEQTDATLRQALGGAVAKETV